MNAPQIILFVNLVVAVLALIISFKKPLHVQHSLNKLLKSLLVFIVCLTIYVLLYNYFFPVADWGDIFAPFVLTYGPIMYFVLRTQISSPPSYKQILGHSVPFLVFMSIQLTLFFIQIELPSPELKTYLQILYSIIVGSLIVYGLWVLLIMRKHQSHINLIMYVALVSNLVIVSILARFYTNVIFKSFSNSHFTGMDIAGVFICNLLLLIVLSVFLIVVNTQSQDETTSSDINETVYEVAPEATIIEVVQSNSSYSNSGLSETDLDNFKKLLDEVISRDKPWLDPNLKLDGLAKALKIPGHHLTQLLSLREGKNFNEYINEKRVEYACHIMDNEENNNGYTELGHRCGFNSKTTFYRWFKKLRQMTPSEYDSLQK